MLPLPVFSASDIRAIDAFTIKTEPIASIDLMERAALSCTRWLTAHYPAGTAFKVICGLGNNGGDGLAITRQLLEAGYRAQAFCVYYASKTSDDFSENKRRLLQFFPQALTEVHSSAQLPVWEPDDVIVDALLGSGLSGPLRGLAADSVTHICSATNEVVSIDIPSGLVMDAFTETHSAVVKATYTLSFQFPKLALLLAGSGSYAGKMVLLDIGLQWDGALPGPPQRFYLTAPYVRGLIKPRATFSHKGSFGHGMLCTGSFGKMGASVLCARAFARSGAGLLTTCIPACGYTIMQCGLPEAMVITNGDKHLISNHIDLELYSAIGVGPGIGTEPETQLFVKYLLEQFRKPMVLDADALNCISLHKDWLNTIPANSILTPHPKEFERLTQKVNNDFERHALQLSFSKTYKVYVVLKGAYTCITTPEGIAYFNSTGNTGLAKGGSGDVLTGLLTGLLAQGYTALEAAITGVFIHGYAADCAKVQKGEMAMLPSDVAEHFSDAFLSLQLG